MTEYLQVALRDGTTKLTCWVDKPVRVGQRVTLKNSEQPDRWWTVVSTGGTTTESPRKTWKVGGLK